MKRLTRIAFILVVVVVGVIAAGVAILKSLDFNSYRGVIAEEVEKAIGRKLTIAGDLKLGISFTPSLMVEGVSLANAPWGSRPEMVTMKRLSAQVELWPLLSGEARVTRVELSGLDAVLETDKQGKGNWVLAAAGKAAAQAEPAASNGGQLPIVPLVKDVVIKNAKVTYRDPAGKTIEAVVDDLTASTGGLNEPIRIAMHGSVGGAKLAVGGKVGPLAILLSGSGSYPVALTAKAFGAEASVDGGLTLKPAPAPDFAVTLKAKDLAAVAKDAAAVVPALAGAGVPAVPLDFTARLLSSGKGYGLEAIRATVGTSDLSGRIGVTVPAGANARPSVTADLGSKKLDLAALVAAMPPAPKAGAASSPTSEASQGGAAKARLFPADPLPLDGLRAVDAKAGFKAASVVLPGGVDLTDFTVDIQLDKGRLKVAPLRAAVAGGTVDGTVSLDASKDTAVLDTNLDAKGVGASKILAKVAGSDLLQGGPTGLAVHLDGKGRSVREIMAGLNGEATLRVGEGRIHNKALNLVGADVVMQLVNALNPLAAKEDYTMLSCAVVRFKVKDGIAKADKGIAIETDKMNVVGSGAVDLRDEKLDFSVKPEAKQGLGINLGSSLAGLVRVQGTLAAPTVGVDKLGAAKTAASVGAALATGGLSVLGEALINKATQDTQPCRTALGLAPVKAEQQAPAKAEPQAPSKSTAPADSGGVKGKVEGLGKTLQGLFGK